MYFARFPLHLGSVGFGGLLVVLGCVFSGYVFVLGMAGLSLLVCFNVGWCCAEPFVFDFRGLCLCCVL